MPDFINYGDGSLYNRLEHIDEIEDRIIYYLISKNNKTEEQLKQTEVVWKLLYYGDDYDALNNESPTYQQVRNLISADNASETQNDKRIFRSPRFEDAWLTESTLLKVYIDSIIPADRYKAVVNIGIDVIAHNKCINIAVDENEETYPVDVVDGVEIHIQTKSRISTLVKAIVSLLNGARIQGVGTLEFSTEMSRFQQAQYGLWNNKNFEGIKLVMGCWMSGVS